MDEVKRIEHDGDPEFYFNFAGEQPRVILLQLNFKAYDEEGESWDDNIAYCICYGYTGGGIQGDWLFKRDLDGYYFYGDSSGDEWKGVREYKGGDVGYGGDDADINKEWSDLDAQAYQKLMSYWVEFFCESEEDEIITIQEKYFNKLSDEESDWSNGFDHDILRDCSEIWNLLTTFE